MYACRPIRDGSLPWPKYVCLDGVKKTEITGKNHVKNVQTVVIELMANSLKNIRNKQYSGVYFTLCLYCFLKMIIVFRQLSIFQSVS